MMKFLCDTGAKSKPRKWKFLTSCVDSFCPLIRPWCVKWFNTKDWFQRLAWTKEKWDRPCFFCQSCNTFRHLVLNFASIAGPVNNELPENQTKTFWQTSWRRTKRLRDAREKIVELPIVAVTGLQGAYTEAPTHAIGILHIYFRRNN